MRKQLTLIVMIAVLMFSIVISVENSRVLVMGPYRGVIIFPGKLALKTGKIIVIDMGTSDVSEFTVKTMMNNRETRQRPGFVVGTTW